jgi:hypothetical protein
LIFLFFIFVKYGYSLRGAGNNNGKYITIGTEGKGVITYMDTSKRKTNCKYRQFKSVWCDEGKIVTYKGIKMWRIYYKRLKG